MLCQLIERIMITDDYLQQGKRMFATTTRRLVVVARKYMMTFDLVEYMASNGPKPKKGLACSQ
jgi:hypothetical protein